MRSPTLQQKFQEYIDANPNRYQPGPEDTIALLFGEDQFKIDQNKWRIRLPEMGWMKLHEKPPRKPDWVAIIRDGENTYIHLNKGDSPYSETSKSYLPVKNGTILAMPYIDFQKIQDKMIGY